MKKNYLFTLGAIFLCSILNAQSGNVGINTTTPSTTLEIKGNSPSTKVEGILIPRFTGDEIFDMPIENTTGNESNLVFATSAASTTNQTGRGENLKGKGFYFWDEGVNKWVSIDSNTTTINNLLAYVKPMNALLIDNNSYNYNALTNPTKPRTPFTVPAATSLRLFDCDYGTGDDIIDNNPLSSTGFVIWDNNEHRIMVPQQLKGYSISINLSLKYEASQNNANVARIVAYTGDATYTTAAGGVHYYSSGGVKLKDVFFKQSKTSTAFTTVRDELVLSPIIVTQSIIDNGIRIFIGSGDNNTVSFYEPVITIDYGVVNTTQ